MSDKIILAVPKGRILLELLPVIERAGIKPEPDFFNKKSRALQFATNHENIDIVRVRSFDVVTFVAFGAAAIGIAGSDVFKEFDSSEIYTPLDLRIGKCRMSVAAPEGEENMDDLLKSGHVRVATKYPKITKEFFASRGIQSECIKLNGAMELAPKLNLCNKIVDLVSTGNTLKANGLKEIEKICDVSSYLIVNRTSYKTRQDEINQIVSKFKAATDA